MQVYSLNQGPVMVMIAW